MYVYVCMHHFLCNTFIGAPTYMYFCDFFVIFAAILYMIMMQ